jgi:hypothetical protein
MGRISIENALYTPPESMPSMRGESGRAGDRNDLVADMDLSTPEARSASADVEVKSLIQLPSRLCFVVVVAGFGFQMTLDGVEGREEEFVVIDWNPLVASGEAGLLLPKTDPPSVDSKSVE